MLWLLLNIKRSQSLNHNYLSPSLSGQVIMDKNPGITCVVNKTSIIDSTYRNFEMEVLAGENNLVTKVEAFSPWYFNVLKAKGIFWRDVMQGCC